jgi:fatty acid desaturase
MRLSSIRRGVFLFPRTPPPNIEDSVSAARPLTIATFWHQVEGPTWLIALAIYGGWFALLRFHAALPWWAIVPLGAWLVAWHGSLQHETIDALQRVPRLLRALLAYPPLGVFVPFGTYRREHRQHHRATAHIAEPAWDPETFYHDPVRWNGYPPALRAIYRVNQTLLGRLTLGALLQLAQTLAHGARAIAAGDREARRSWAVHAALVALLFWWLAAVAKMPWWQYVALIAYPGACLAMLRSFSEHRLADDAAHRTATIENRFPFGLLFLNNNYHAIHHAAPSLPWYRIPAVWRAERTALIERSGGFHYAGYATIARRWLVRTVFEPVRTVE